MASKVGISKSSMSRILSGAQEPKLHLAYELARALGVTLDYLVDDSPEFDPAAQLVVVSEDEQTILKIVRRLGVDTSIDRLLGLTSLASGEELGRSLESHELSPHSKLSRRDRFEKKS